MNIQNKLENLKMDVKLKLAMLWASFMFLYTYIDYFHIYMPSTLKDIRKRRVFVFDITQEFLLVALFFVVIPVLLIFLSVVLAAKVNRWTNIIVATVFICYLLFNLAGEAWVYMYFTAADVVLLCLIIRYAYKWPRQLGV